MTRPRTVKYGEGEIKLHGFTKEQSDQIEELLFGADVKPEPIAIAEPVFELEEPTQPLDKTALSFIKIDKAYNCVTVSYNLETMEARVTKVETLSTNKNIADSKFSVKITKEFFFK